MTTLFTNIPSFTFVDGVQTPDADNKIKVIFTVYSKDGKEYHFPFSQNVTVGYDGGLDLDTTYRNIISNMFTYDKLLKQGILKEDQTVEAIAARQSTPPKAESVEGNTTSSTSTNTTSTASTDSTVNHGSVA